MQSVFAQNVYTLPKASCQTVTNCWAYDTDGSTKIYFMCYNLGAETSTLNPLLYNGGAINGDYYQWGRSKDGHQKVNAPTITTAFATNAEATLPASVIGKRILAGTSYPYDWATGVPYASRWNDTTKSATDPCPSGFRVPSSALLTRVINANIKTWDTGLKLGNNLFLPAAGRMWSTMTSLSLTGIRAEYWTSSISTTGYVAPNRLICDGPSYVGGPFGPSISASEPMNGYSIRCVAE